MQSNPEPLCYVDLEALVIVCTDGSAKNGAELVDVAETEDPDLIQATYVNPETGMAEQEILPILPPIDLEGEPQWKKDGHCCESCAHGHACEGGACELGATEEEVGSALAGIAIPRHRSVRNPKRSSRIFSRRN